MRIKTIIVLLCCIVLFAGCGPTTTSKLEKTDGATVISPREVLTLVDNNTLFVHSFEEDSYLYFDHSGKLFGKDIYANNDSGHWDVSEDGDLCMRMTNWWYGDLRCFQVLVAQSTYFLAKSDGVLQYSAEQLTGDSQHLYRNTNSRKKSYRSSLRKDNPPEQTPAAKQPPPANQPEESKSITEESQYSGSQPEADLHSTVKWMAKDCPNCNLAESDLDKANLIKANLAGANLRWASLKMANLRRANLEGANLASANLSFANLPGANLKDADLSGANLRGANLIRANLTGANLEDAVFTDALLEGVIGMKR
jgi:hypothetical protein